MKGIVINKGEKVFTLLANIFDSINNIQRKYNWLITGHECYPQNKKYAEILSKEWCWLTGDELTDMVEDENFQWIWGVLSAFPKHIKKETILKYKLPRARENSKIWQNPISMQHTLSVMEIIAWDSSMTVVISKCDDVINQLKSDKPWAEDLEQYNNSIGKKDGI